MTWAPPTAGTAGGASPGLLPTPGATDGQGGPKRLRDDGRTEADHGAALRDAAVDLLPTPVVSGSHGNQNRGGSRGDELLLAGLAEAHAAGDLLPTPTPSAGNFNDGESLESWQARRDRLLAEGVNGNGMGTPLGIAVQLLPTPGARLGDERRGAPSAQLAAERFASGRRNLDDAVAQSDRWGRYAPAVARWEHLTGRLAPDPTQPGTKGQPRLAPAFVEWLMGLPAGWVTDVPGVSRTAALTMLGNGQVPQQAAAALRSLLSGAA